MKVLKNPDDANDALLETFTHIIDNVERFMEVEHIEGFIMVTTKNVALNLYKQKSVHHSRVISSTYYENDNSKNIQIDIPDDSMNLEQLVIDNELIDEIKQLLSSLPVELSTVVTYKYLYNMRNTDIAKLLKIDRSLVNVRLFRAKQRLQKLLLERNYHI
jgi:RNA polymerase sigma-70 factor (ECF subfamily)